MNTKKYRLLQTLTSLSVATLIASNIITNKQTDLFGCRDLRHLHDSCGLYRLRRPR